MKRLVGYFGIVVAVVLLLGVATDAQLLRALELLNQSAGQQPGE